MQLSVIKSTLSLCFVFFLGILISQAQFYRGSYQEYGKNRLQYQEFEWKHSDFEQFNVYYYGTGRSLAEYTSERTLDLLKVFQKRLDFGLSGKVLIIIFNNHSEFKQSNVGLETGEDKIGGVTQIQGNKMFIYFDGDHQNFDEQLRNGLTRILLNQFMYGESWREVAKNNTLLTLPEWYLNGLESFVSQPWSVQTDDQVRDIIMNRRFKKFNRLSGDDATMAGHALWNYIAEVYGTEVIPNVLYMTRISRSVESGFLFVLGVSLNNLLLEAGEYYRNKYASDEKNRLVPPEPISTRVKKSREYMRFRVNPQGDKAVWVTNELGQYKVWLYDAEKEKRKRILKGEHKLDRLVDENYPIVEWHPNGEELAIINEKKGEIWLNTYSFIEKKWNKKQLRRLERVISFSYSPDGTRIALSAINGGQSDIYEYKVLTSSQKQLTDDIYDDLDPRYMNDPTYRILFSSNRTTDSLMPEGLPPFGKTFDLFQFDPELEDQVVQLTKTPYFNESQPFGLNEKQFFFLSDQNGIVNRYLGQRDSAISHIDTTIHYRYFTSAQPVTNYKRNIKEHFVEPSADRISEILYVDGKHNFYFESIAAQKPLDALALTSYFEFLRGRDGDESGVEIQPKETAIEQKPTLEEGEVDILNYQFSSETVEENSNTPQPVVNANQVALKSDPDAIIKQNVPQAPKPEGFKMPLIENYRVAMRATQLTTQFDFDFANQLYQPFNGGPYVPPGMGLVTKVSIFDVMEDYNFEGGMRLSFNGDNTEFFFSYTNRRKKIDKKYTFQRQVIVQPFGDFGLGKMQIHQVKGEYNIPFSEVFALRATASVRNDQQVTLSTDQQSLLTPDAMSWWLGGKVEFVFDNVRKLDLNLWSGTRWKIFAERYQVAGAPETDINIIGLDYRKYIKIHRNFIWANRLSASSSFGSRKLVYYLGSVDNWMLLSDRPRFDFSQNVASDQNYIWQTIATPLRGFPQNVRNGNSFALINSELRLPLFQYLLNKPIKSDLIRYFQVVGFGDIGTAWTGWNPYSDDNSFNIKTYDTGPNGSLEVRVRNQVDPVVGAYGFGLRAKVLGYFVRWDYAWGVVDGIVQKPSSFVSLSLDF